MKNLSPSPAAIAITVELLILAAVWGLIFAVLPPWASVMLIFAFAGIGVGYFAGLAGDALATALRKRAAERSAS